MHMIGKKWPKNMKSKEIGKAYIAKWQCLHSINQDKMIGRSC